MNTQEKYLRRQLEQVNEEMGNIIRKFERLKNRLNQLREEKEALEEDLKSLTSQPRKKEDLKIAGVRKMNFQSSK